MSKNIYKNKNGNLSTEDFVRMIHKKELIEWLRGHRLNTHPCPPIELLPSEPMCTYCVQCFKECAGLVKEYKSHYTARRVKYLKKDLDD